MRRTISTIQTISTTTVATVQPMAENMNPQPNYLQMAPRANYITKLNIKYFFFEIKKENPLP